MDYDDIIEEVGYFLAEARDALQCARDVIAEAMTQEKLARSQASKAALAAARAKYDRFDHGTERPS
ncbi:MAG: hypothetical protein EBS70_01875 [Actinobacteria bacterium]|jgi:hypothetical protein|nr:hypothetical protein [Actinomycetota bacterium]